MPPAMPPVLPSPPPAPREHRHHTASSDALVVGGAGDHGDVYGHFDAATVAHAWCGLVGFVLFFPLTAAAARYARPQGAAAPPCGKTVAKQARLLLPAPQPSPLPTPRAAPRACPLLTPSTLASQWLRMHRAVGWAGALCVLLGGVCIEVHKFEGRHEHFKSYHALAGIAAYALALMQPLLAHARPPAAGVNAPQRARRRAWRASHLLSALLILGLGVYACVSGVDKTVSHQLQGAEAYPALLCYWLALLGAAAAALELWRCRGRFRRRSSKRLLGGLGGGVRIADGAPRECTSMAELSEVSTTAAAGGGGGGGGGAAAGDGAEGKGATHTKEELEALSKGQLIELILAGRPEDKI